MKVNELSATDQGFVRHGYMDVQSISKTELQRMHSLFTQFLTEGCRLTAEGDSIAIQILFTET